MTSPQPGAVLIVLTDGEANLAHYMDLLRADGTRVLATARPYDAVAHIARHERCVLLVRYELLGADAPDFLRQARALRADTFMIVSVAPNVDVSACDATADLVLREPFLYSTFQDAVCCGSARRDRLRHLSSEPVSAATPMGLVPPVSESTRSIASVATAGSATEWQRVVDYARRMSCEERDRQRLHALALQMFMDIADAEAGVLWLKRPGQEDWDLVEGFVPTEGLDESLPLSGAASAALLHGHPALSTLALTPASADLRQAPLLLIPIVDQQDHHGLVALARPRAEPFSNRAFPELEALALQFVANLSNARRLAELDNMAVVDPLTGLFNRRHFDRLFSQELNRAKRHDRCVTLVLIDVDKFKTINDLNGYSTGDAVIRAVADVLLRGFRDVDTVTRWGGDEFAVLLPDTGRARPAFADVGEYADPVNRVRHSVERADFRLLVPRLKGKVTVSAGVAVYPTDANDRDTLFAAANRALQRAKKCGPNRVVRFGEVHTDSAERFDVQG